MSFGLLPLWIAAGVGVPLERVALARLLVGPFAVAAHLANTLKDFEGDAAMRSGNLAQRLGRRAGIVLAVVLAVGVGIGAGIGLAADGTARPAVDSCSGSSACWPSRRGSRRASAVGRHARRRRALDGRLGARDRLIARRSRRQMRRATRQG